VFLLLILVGHSLFIATLDAQDSKEVEQYIIAVLQTPENGQFRAVKITKRVRQRWFD
jgi:hypothetical protein